MAENGGTSTGEAIDDDEEKYNYYHCKCAYWCAGNSFITII